LDSAKSSKLVAKEGEAFVRALQGLDKGKATANVVRGESAPAKVAKGSAITEATTETVVQGGKAAEKLVEASKTTELAKPGEDLFVGTFWIKTNSFATSRCSRCS